LAFYCYALPEITYWRVPLFSNYSDLAYARLHFYWMVLLMPLAGFSTIGSGANSGAGISVFAALLVWAFACVQVGFLMYGRPSFFIDHGLMRNSQTSMDLELLESFGQHEEKVGSEKPFWPPYRSIQWCMFWCPDGIINTLLFTTHRLVLVRRDTKWPFAGSLEYATHWLKSLPGFVLSSHDYCCDDTTCIWPGCIARNMWIYVMLCCIPSPCYVCIDRGCVCQCVETELTFPTDPNSAIQRGSVLKFPMIPKMSYDIRHNLLRITDMWKKILVTD